MPDREVLKKALMSRSGRILDVIRNCPKTDRVAVRVLDGVVASVETYAGVMSALVRGGDEWLCDFPRHPSPDIVWLEQLIDKQLDRDEAADDGEVEDG